MTPTRVDQLYFDSVPQVRLSHWHRGRVALADDGWQVVVLMRLRPIVPFNLQNYALGVTSIPFLQYLTATLIGTVPGIAIYVYFGVFGKGLGSGPTVLD
jgi:uncharacterized membrane protein YdjX (TVP38/TMEM64 family)